METHIGQWIFEVDSQVFHQAYGIDDIIGGVTAAFKRKVTGQSTGVSHNTKTDIWQQHF